MKALFNALRRRFRSPLMVDKVHVAADPTHPHVGLSIFSESRIPGPSLCIEGISLAEARVDLCGKVIDWQKMSPLQAEAIRAGGRVTLPLSTLKSLFK